MTKKECPEAITVEDLAVIVSNQNYYTRNVVAMVINFIETLFVAFVILAATILVDCFVVVGALSMDNPIPVLVVVAIISVPVICVAIAVPLKCFKKHAEEIGSLHQQCTELEASRLGKGQGEADGES